MNPVNINLCHKTGKQYADLLHDFLMAGVSKFDILWFDLLIYLQNNYLKYLLYIHVYFWVENIILKRKVFSILVT